MPVFELRGGIPLALSFGIPLVPAFIISVLGTMLPVPFILVFFKFLVKKFKKVRFIGPILTKLNDKASKKAGTLGKFQYIGLMIFAALPIPGTGAWTSSMAASVLGLRIKYSLIAIFLGVIECAVIMSILAYGLLDYIISVIK